MLEHLAASKGIELTLFIDPAIPDEVLGDALRLRQIVVNLINNAIKFSSGQGRAGKVATQVLLIEADRNQVMIAIQVTDNGIGMNEETRGRLFIPFTQGDTSTTRRFGGTGLGLTITHHLVKLMGGEIAVQSKEGEGSTFIVHIPFKPLPSEITTYQKQIDLTGLSCIVYGPNEGLSNDLVAYLKYAGANVERATDLAAARKRIKTLPAGQWLLVIDAGHDESSVDELRLAFRTRLNLDSPDKPHLVVVKRGRRHRGRIENGEQVTLDGNILYRFAFLHAVAVAAGRAKLEEDIPALEGSSTRIILPSREEALQQGRLILVAEDNEINQKVIRQQLALLGHVADVVQNGRHALQHWESGDYAMILTDLHMPEMDGYQLTQAIRTATKGPIHIPIIALTANALKGEAERCRAIGMDDYLSKPVQLEQLKQTLQKWLPKHSENSKSPKQVEQWAINQQAVPVDIRVLQALVGDDPAVIQEFLSDFRTSAQAIQDQLHTAYQQQHLDQVKAVAHKLKSSARSVGAQMLGEWCEKIEQAARNHDEQSVTSLLPQFDAELQAVKHYLETINA